MASLRSGWGAKQPKFCQAQVWTSSILMVNATSVGLATLKLQRWAWSHQAHTNKAGLGCIMPTRYKENTLVWPCSQHPWLISTRLTYPLAKEGQRVLQIHQRHWCCCDWTGPDLAWLPVAISDCAPEQHS